MAHATTRTSADVRARNSGLSRSIRAHALSPVFLSTNTTPRLSDGPGDDVLILDGPAKAASQMRETSPRTAAKPSSALGDGVSWNAGRALGVPLDDGDAPADGGA